MILIFCSNYVSHKLSDPNQTIAWSMLKAMCNFRGTGLRFYEKITVCKYSRSLNFTFNEINSNKDSFQSRLNR